jgi:hypothetical protein
MIDIIPPSWQFSEICRARMRFEGRSFAHRDYKDSQWFQTAELIVDDTIAGDVRVVYLEPVIPSHDCPFLPEEQKTSYAVMIGGINKPARLLRSKNETSVREQGAA